jgi:hypothetical protein
MLPHLGIEAAVISSLDVRLPHLLPHGRLEGDRLVDGVPARRVPAAVRVYLAQPVCSIHQPGGVRRSWVVQRRMHGPAAWCWVMPAAVRNDRALIVAAKVGHTALHACIPLCQLPSHVDLVVLQQRLPWLPGPHQSSTADSSASHTASCSLLAMEML